VNLYKLNYFILAFLNCLFVEVFASDFQDDFVSKVSFISYEEAVTKAKQYGLKLPSSERDGRILTLNQKGVMAPTFDLIIQDFLKDIQGKKVLEIGAAYGNVLLEGLKKECTHYTVNDLDLRHLMIAALE